MYGGGWHKFVLVILCAKFKNSNMFPSGIFWCGYSCCSSCDRGITKSTPSPRLKSGLWTGVWQNLRDTLDGPSGASFGKLATGLMSEFCE